jgi:cell division GTPase FtsZ
MRVAVIGIGQAGGRVADLLTYHSLYGMARDSVPFSLAINTARADLSVLRTIPQRDRILIGESQVRGHGVGLIRNVATAIATDALPTIMREIVRKNLEYVDAFWLIAGLGGGTGSGSVPVIARRLKELYEQPVFVLGVLPTRDEGELMAENATTCLAELHSVVDGILIFDNDMWTKEGLSLEQCYKFMNYELVRPFPLLLAAGEVTGTDVGIKVVDASDITATWKDLAFIGHWKLKASALRPRFPLFFWKKKVEVIGPTLACSTVVRNAATKMSGDFSPDKVGRILIVLAGRREHISMEGYSEVRNWLRSYMPNAEIRGGDFPIRRAKELDAILLVGGVRSLPRLGLNLGEKR